jgi:hypothetical protein
MAQPVWITPAGPLEGPVPEGVFFEKPLEAYDPDGNDVYFELIAGKLPDGMQLQQTGTVSGIPVAKLDFQGVPALVSTDVTSKFAIRAYTRRTVNGVTVINRLADRTFTLTITGQDVPEFITPAGVIGTFYDGEQISPIQIQYTDTDPSDIVTIRLIAGQLPPGTVLSPRGLITGYIIPESPIDATAGYSRDDQGYDEYPYDFSTQSVDITYEFALEVSDGKGSDVRAFSIQVYARSSLTADNSLITADNTFVTADASPVRVPFIVTPTGSIGTVRNDNFFAFQFIGLELDGDQFEFVSVTALPPGLTLDPKSGWLYGYIPNLGITSNTYDFTLRVFETNNPLVISNDYNYSLTITGPIDSEIIWLTDSDLGTIANGATSIFYVEAVNIGGLELQYQLLSGSDSNLPQGLQLLPSGEIAGRVSFNTFALDGGTTTFNITKENGSDPTTFDMTHRFTVVAFSQNEIVNVSKEFSITVIREYNEPYENLYIQCMPPQDDRELINSLIQNSDIFQPELIYRSQDPNFGVASRVIYNHAYGLTAATIEEYYSSLTKNHYWKNLILGSIETAQATDSLGNVIYEVVYSRVVDDLVNNAGESVEKEVVLPFPVNYGDDLADVTTVYPNSLVNMRDQVIDVVGQISNILPLWMLSKQANGRVLGFTPSWVIAYTKPGKAEQIVYYIQQQFGDQLNLVDFEVDRYELDRLLTKNWDPVYDSTVGSWVPSPPQLTTFDIDAHYQLPVPNDSSLAFDGGIDYAVEDRIRILGSQLGGLDEVNDVIVTVEAVDALGTITQARAAGIAPLLTVGVVYTNIVGTNITGIGSGATWDIETVGEDATIFDGGSLQFIAPVDMYSNTQAYDKYLVFPKRNILE